jgi:hypothetical protein
VSLSAKFSTSLTTFDSEAVFAVVPDPVVSYPDVSVASIASLVPGKEGHRFSLQKETSFFVFF